MPDKHEVGGSSPLGPTSKVLDLAKVFIENRIEKRNETDSCILRKTCYENKRFFRISNGKNTISSTW